MSTSTRSYRFGIFYAILNLALGAYYLLMTGLALRRASGSVFLTPLVACLIAVAAGIGLIRKRLWGLGLVYFTLAVAWIREIVRWFRPTVGYPGMPSSLQPHRNSLLQELAVDLFFLVLTVPFVIYFQKRRNEFS